MAAPLRAPIILYKSELMHSVLGTVKLRQNFDDGTYKEKKCPIFTGEHGIEALLYVEERFRKLATRVLLWTTGPELFDGFEEVLLDTALSNWEDIISTIADVDKTPARFEQAIQTMYRKYVGAEARDIQFEYFKSLMKPLKASTLDHSSRMLTLARYGNRLPGTEPVLTDDQVKKIIFQSYPLLWQQQYVRSGQRVSNSTLSEIVEFMSNEKLFADTQNATRAFEKKKPFQTNKEDSGGSFKKRKYSSGKKPYVHNKKPKEYHGTPGGSLKPDSECPIHGGHPWMKCFDNPNGDSFKPRGPDGKRPFIGGRGRGRGGPMNSPGRGRGNGNGRGAGQYTFQAAKLPTTSENTAPTAGFAGNSEQHHFDRIGKDPEWGWDADAKPPGE
jgi:hypothetical protein